MAVADGMGGAVGGEIASSEAVGRLAEKLSHMSVSDPTEGLRGAIQEINHDLHSLSASKPELHGMGTTLVAAVVRDRRAWLANVGDSRAYLIKGPHAKRITQDHSLVAEQVRSGYMTEEEARQSDQRNVITRSLGPLPTVQVDTVGPLRLTGGTHLVLCSDGLHGAVEDEEIYDAAVSERPGQSARRLVALANKRGGVDNISVIVYQAPSGPDDTMALPGIGGRTGRIASVGRALRLIASGGSVLGCLWRLLSRLRKGRSEHLTSRSRGRTKGRNESTVDPRAKEAQDE